MLSFLYEQRQEISKKECFDKPLYIRYNLLPILVLTIQT